MQIFGRLRISASPIHACNGVALISSRFARINRTIRRTGTTKDARAIFDGYAEQGQGDGGKS